MKTKILTSIIFLIGLTLGVNAGENIVNNPSGNVVPKAVQNAPKGPIPPEIERVMQMPEGKERLDVISAASPEWCKNDPTTALAWAHQPKVIYKEYLNIIGNCGKIHGKLTADWCVQNRQYITLHKSLSSWVAVDRSAAAEWCLQTPDEVRHIAFSSLGYFWGGKDPLAAAGWASELKSLEDRRSMAYGIGSGWTAPRNGVVDFSGATTWALGLKSQEERLSAIYGIGSGQWGVQEFPAFTSWVKTLKGKEELRVAALVGINKIPKGSILDKSGKDDAPASARAWLDQLPLSDSDKTEILNTRLTINTHQTGKVVWPK